jgi:hypothetical protein
MGPGVTLARFQDLGAVRHCQRGPRFTHARERAMGATARTALLLPLAALAGCARLMGYHPQEWYDARTACRQEMNERVPRSEPPEIRGAYVEQCMKDRGFPN